MRQVMVGLVGIDYAHRHREHYSRARPSRSRRGFVGALLCEPQRVRPPGAAQVRPFASLAIRCGSQTRAPFRGAGFSPLHGSITCCIQNEFQRHIHSHVEAA